MLVDNALKAGQDKNIGHEYIKDIEERYRENSRDSVPTPWTKLMIYYKVDWEMEILVLYLVIQEVVNRGP